MSNEQLAMSNDYVKLYGLTDICLDNASIVFSGSLKGKNRILHFSLILNRQVIRHLIIVLSGLLLIVSNLAHIFADTPICRQL